MGHRLLRPRPSLHRARRSCSTVSPTMHPIGPQHQIRQPRVRNSPNPDAAAVLLTKDVAGRSADRVSALASDPLMSTLSMTTGPDVYASRSAVQWISVDFPDVDFPEAGGPMIAVGRPRLRTPESPCRGNHRRVAGDVDLLKPWARARQGDSPCVWWFSAHAGSCATHAPATGRPLNVARRRAEGPDQAWPAALSPDDSRRRFWAHEHHHEARYGRCRCRRVHGRRRCSGLGSGARGCLPSTADDREWRRRPNTQHRTPRHDRVEARAPDGSPSSDRPRSRLGPSHGARPGGRGEHTPV